MKKESIWRNEIYLALIGGVVGVLLQIALDKFLGNTPSSWTSWSIAIILLMILLISGMIYRKLKEIR
ncbi:MAG: hypothetical protein FWH55_11400 [Oscillospiraceae bacterium]|nr:hypothetical protein [Oscillospiraceae bacterium]